MTEGGPTLCSLMGAINICRPHQQLMSCSVRTQSITIEPSADSVVQQILTDETAALLLSLHA